MIGPDDPLDAKERHLRELFRRHQPPARWSRDKLIVDQVAQAEQTRLVNAEFDRLFPGTDRELLANILQSAWIEARELQGQRYDYEKQTWLDRDGNRIIHRSK